MSLSKRLQILEAKQVEGDICQLVIVTRAGSSDDDVIGLSGPDGMIERVPHESMDELGDRVALAWTRAGRLSGSPIIVLATYCSEGEP